MNDLTTMGKLAKQASRQLAQTTNQQRNDALEAIADALHNESEAILKANNEDITAAKQNGLNPGTIDRLTLNTKRIQAMIDGLQEVIAQPDPIHQTLSQTVQENGLSITKISVPLGVIGMIYESRPNVTIDAAALSIKSGNAVILRGGKEAIHTNIALVSLIRSALKQVNLDSDCVQLIDNTDRSLVNAMLTMNDVFDVVIPRGGKSLIDNVIRTATVPVIQTGTGNNTLYVDKSADVNKALAVVENAKCQRISVCNCIENLCVHQAIANTFLPMLAQRLSRYEMTYYGDEIACSLIEGCLKAEDEQYACEFLDYKLAVKVVKDVHEAIDMIDRFGTHHSEGILAEDPQVIATFLNNVDAAAVYVNASTRFSDGYEFGLGCEIGISTQKLHARGPMGLQALTTIQYQVTADYLIRS